MRLHRGDYDDVVETAGDPVALARRFAAGGRAPDPPRRPRRRPRGPRAAGARAARGRRDRAGPRSRPRAASARSTTPRRCSRPAPTASSSAPPRSPTRRPGPRRSASGSSSRSTCSDGMVRTAGWTAESGLTLRAGGRALPRGRGRARPLHGDRPRRHARRARPRARRRGRRVRARTCSRPAACARRPTSRSSPPRAPRRRSSGAPSSPIASGAFGVRKPDVAPVDPVDHGCLSCSRGPRTAGRGDDTR